MKHKTYITIIGTLLITIQYTYSQQITGNLEGLLSDGNGTVIASANVTVAGSDMQGSRGTATDNRGRFRIIGLPIGKYDVTFSHIGYHEVTLKNISVRLGETTTLGERQLIPRAFQMPAVTITGESSTIDPSSTTMGDNLTLGTIDALPVARDYRSIASLIPQANTSYYGDEVNISGGTGLENTYFIDGVNVTDPYRGATSTNLPYNLIKEIQIKTGGYEAEYRSALGGVINVITHSGGNQFRGHAFGFFTNQALSANRRLTVSEAQVDAFTNADFGLSLGGPIIKDRLWFHAAYNHNVEREDIEIPGYGYNPDKITRKIFSGKLTWQPASKTNIVMGVFGDPTSQNRIGPSNPGLPAPSSLANLDPFLGKWTTGGLSATILARHIASETVMFELDLARTTREDFNEAQTTVGAEESLFMDLQSGQWSGGYGVFLKAKSARNAAKATASVFAGSHELKAGLEYENGVLDGATLNASIILKLSDDLYQTIDNYKGGLVRTHSPSVFVQDSWAINPRLRFNLGVRWDAIYFMDPNGNLAQSITDQFQPRIGAIFQPGEVGKQKIFGSYGRFYEQLPLYVASRYTEGWEYIVFYNQDPRISTVGGDTTEASGKINISPKVDGLEGQYFDEFTLGYERQLDNHHRLTVRALYRNLRQAIEDGYTGEDGFVFGNPGRGKLAFLPEFNREYMALELTLARLNSRHLNYNISYVLSRNTGNYAGLFDIENGLGPIPNSSRHLDIPEQIPNSRGLLATDRTHSFKFNGSYFFNFGLTLGTAFIMQRGSPLTEFGGTSFGLPVYSYLTPRGSLGRMPTIWDLNIRLTYALPNLRSSRLTSRLIFDLLHVGNPREVVDIDQIHYLGVDVEGNQVGKIRLIFSPKLFRRRFQQGLAWK